MELSVECEPVSVAPTQLFGQTAIRSCHLARAAVGRPLSVVVPEVAVGSGLAPRKSRRSGHGSRGPTIDDDLGRLEAGTFVRRKK
jgi:hypothetical protein